MFSRFFIRPIAYSLVAGMVPAVTSAAITIQTVRVGEVGNAGDARVMSDGSSGFGSVSYEYNMGAHEVTNAEYVAFLNAVAAIDTFGLFNADMAGPYGGVVQIGEPGSYTYTIVSGRGSNPVNFVSFWDACRFANWLHNGQPVGAQDVSTTEDGVYTLTPQTISDNTVTRKSGWRWAVASEDEWHKAAYHQPAIAGGPPGDYWLYPTSSDTISHAEANYFGNGIFNTTPVGTYAANCYGAFDMGGNVQEWVESIMRRDNRGRRGGSFFDGVGDLRAYIRNDLGPTDELMYLGFRVSSIAHDCGADFNHDGFLDYTDFDDFVAAFESGDPACDVNGDTFLDYTDFDDFVASFEAGC